MKYLDYEISEFKITETLYGWYVSGVINGCACGQAFECIGQPSEEYAARALVANYIYPRTLD